MKPNSPLQVIFVFLLITFIGVPGRSAAADVTWINPAGGSWSLPQNWSPATVPGVGDSAFITLDGTYTVTLDVDAAVTVLTLGAATGTQTFSSTSRVITVQQSLEVSANGVLILDNSAITGPGALSNAGTIQATGNTHVDVPFINAGTIEPGMATGTLKIQDDLDLTSTSVINIKIGGRPTGSNFDQLTISGFGHLDGALNVSLTNGFVPDPGDLFPILTYSGHSGTFLSMTGLSLGNDLFFIPDYPSFGSGGVTLLTVRQGWKELSPTGSKPAVRYNHSMVYDAGTGRMILFGGGTSVSDFMNDTWILTHAQGLGGTPSWILLSVQGQTPSPRGNHSAVYEAASNRMIVFGGSNPGYTDEVWILTNANGLGGVSEWQQLTPVGSPGVRTSHSAVYNPASNRMIVFGGNNGPAHYDDVWILSHANGLGGTPVWSQLSTSGDQPVARSGHTAVYDPVGNVMTVFGGSPNPSALDDVRTLTHADGTGGLPVWSTLPVTNGPPPGRFAHSSVYDPVANRMLSFGGLGMGGFWDEVLLLARPTGSGGPSSWTILPGSTDRPRARAGHRAVFDPASRRMIVFGGVAEDYSNLNDVWVLDITGGNNELTAVPLPVPDPPPTLSLAPPSPNPSRGAVEFSVVTDVSGPAEVTLFDVSGREISVIHRGFLAAGPHRFSWNGLGSNGTRLPSGVYMVRIHAENTSVSRRFSLIR